MAKSQRWHPRPKVIYLILGAVLVAAIFLAFAWPKGERFYTDGISVRTVTDSVPIREVVWETPIPFIAEFDEAPDDFDPELSADGRTIIFARGRPETNTDLFVSYFDGATWSPPSPIDGVNTESNEMGPELSQDGQFLYFYSDRKGGLGGYDIYAARRQGSGWTDPVNLGDGVNSPFDEYDPALTPAGDRLFFSSNRPRSVPGEEDETDDPAWSATLRLKRAALDFDIFSSDREITPDPEPGTAAPPPLWSPAGRVDQLNSPADEGQINFTARGDFLYFSSDREGGLGRFDIYRSRLIHGDILPPENLGAAINSEFDEMDPALWLEGYGLLFTSNRRGDSPDKFMLFQTITREVIVEETGFNWGALWTALDDIKWWILLLLAALLGLIWLILTLIDDEKRQKMGLTQICFLVSAAAHLLIAFLLSLWIISQQVIQSSQPMEVNIDSGALAEERMALEIREVVDALPNTEPPPAPEPFESLSIPPTPPPQPMDAVTQEFAAEPLKLDHVPVNLDANPSEQTAEIQPDRLNPAALDIEIASLQLDAPAIQLESAVPVAAEASPQFSAPQEITETTKLTADIEPEAAKLQPADFSTNDALAELQTAPAIAIELEEAESTAESSPTLAPIPFEANLESPTVAAPLFDLESAPVVAAAESPKLAPAADTPAFRGEADPQLQPLSTASAPENIQADVTADALPGAAEPTDLKQPESAVGKGDSVTEKTTIDLPALASLDLPLGTELPGLELGNPMLLEAPATIDNPFLLRNPDKRKEMLEMLGGSADTEAAISAALGWFTRNQEPDGSWSMRRHGGEHGHDMSATSMAALCYMGWGATHKKEGPYQPTLTKAIDWLISKAKPDGDLRGDGGNMYDQGIATIALAEAYGLTKDERLKPILEKAAQFIANAQSNVGSWRYKPDDRNGGDTSIYGWQVMALKSCKMSGINIPEEAWQKAPVWLDKAGGGQHGGLYGYNNASPKPAMVAEGLFSRQLLGTPPTHPMMAESVNYLNTALPDPGKVNYYLLYYGTLALYQHKGPVWDEWNDRMKKFLLGAQRKGGNDDGSWDPRGEHANQSGRVIITAMATLSLEVYYRYLPMYGGNPDAK